MSEIGLFEKDELSMLVINLLYGIYFYSEKKYYCNLYKNLKGIEVQTIKEFLKHEDSSQNYRFITGRLKSTTNYVHINYVNNIIISDIHKNIFSKKISALSIDINEDSKFINFRRSSLKYLNLGTFLGLLFNLENMIFLWSFVFGNPKMLNLLSIYLFINYYFNSRYLKSGDMISVLLEMQPNSRNRYLASPLYFIQGNKISLLKYLKDKTNKYKLLHGLCLAFGIFGLLKVSIGLILRTLRRVDERKTTNKILNCSRCDNIINTINLSCMHFVFCKSCLKSCNFKCAICNTVAEEFYLVDDV
jgi:hypothetical protein